MFNRKKMFYMSTVFRNVSINVYFKNLSTNLSLGSVLTMDIYRHHKCVIQFTLEMYLKSLTVRQCNNKDGNDCYRSCTDF